MITQANHWEVDIGFISKSKFEIVYIIINQQNKENRQNQFVKIQMKRTRVH